MNTGTPPLQLQCPCCQKTLYWTDEYPFRPFCSERCRLIDLGEWASEKNRIAGTPELPDDLNPEDLC